MDTESIDRELINFIEVPHELQVETLNWRNSPEVSRYFQIDNIPLDVHLKWLQSLTLPSPHSVAFLIEVGGSHVGVTYFHSINYQNRTCEWGIYIYRPEFTGGGTGQWALKECCDFAKYKLGMNKVLLDVLSGNDRAEAVYKKVGFTQIEQFDNSGLDVIRMEKTL